MAGIRAVVGDNGGAYVAEGEIGGDEAVNVRAVFLGIELARGKSLKGHFQHVGRLVQGQKNFVDLAVRDLCEGFVYGNAVHGCIEKHVGNDLHGHVERGKEGIAVRAAGCAEIGVGEGKLKAFVCGNVLPTKADGVNVVGAVRCALAALAHKRNGEAVCKERAAKLDLYVQCELHGHRFAKSCGIAVVGKIAIDHRAEILGHRFGQAVEEDRGEAFRAVRCAEIYVRLALHENSIGSRDLNGVNDTLCILIAIYGIVNLEVQEAEGIEIYLAIELQIHRIGFAVGQLQEAEIFKEIAVKLGRIADHIGVSQSLDVFNRIAADITYAVLVIIFTFCKLYFANITYVIAIFVGTGG